MFRKPARRPERRFRPAPIDRPALVRQALEQFNRGAYGEAHEAWEAIWRPVLRRRGSNSRTDL